MRGPNTRAIAARARNKEAQERKQAEEEKKKVDTVWKDEYTEEVLKKKDELLSKQMERMKRKDELKRIKEEDEIQHSSKTNKNSNKDTPIKLTQAEIQKRALQSSLKNAKSKDDKVSQQGLLIPNRNHILLEEAQSAHELGQEFIAASSVDDFLATVEKVKTVDHATYEQEWMPKMRQEYPMLKRSQLKEKIWQQWLKAPENPYVQRTQISR